LDNKVSDIIDGRSNREVSVRFFLPQNVFVYKEKRVTIKQ